MTLAELYTWPKGNLHTGRYGLEIETEAERRYAFTTNMEAGELWAVHNDGSLRNIGYEYVLRRPLDYKSKEWKLAMDQFNEQAKTANFIDSVYTSVHVHLNFLERTLPEIFNFIGLYLLFEEVLTEYCGNERNGNLFCLKFSDAEANLNAVMSLATAIEAGTGLNEFKRLNADRLKYAALNIVPLRNFGSLEVRTHPGCNDTKKIEQWVEVLDAMYEKARKYENPLEIVQQIKGNRSLNSFFDEVFGASGKILNTTDLATKLEEGIWYLTMLGSKIKWKGFGTKNKVAPKSRLEEYTQVLYEDRIPRPEPRLRIDPGGVTWATNNVVNTHDGTITGRIPTPRPALDVRRVREPNTGTVQEVIEPIANELVRVHGWTIQGDR